MIDVARALQASGLLRFVAFAIAIAGFIDPAISVSGFSRARVAAVVQQPASPAAGSVRDRLIRDLSTSYDIVSNVTSDTAAAVVIGERYPDEPMPDSLLVATVTTADVTTPGVRIIRVDAPHEVPAATVIRLDVELGGFRIAGRTTDVTVGIAGLEVGRASHRWTADEEQWRASIDAVPVGEPPFVLRVEAKTGQVRLKPDTTETVVDATPAGKTPVTPVRLKPDTTETVVDATPAGKTPVTPVRLKPDTTETVVDATPAGETPVVSGFSRTVADVVVDVRRAPFRVQFYDPRPSWATTFLRRALEADVRFQVATLSFISRGISAQTGGDVPLGDPRIDRFDVVIVGGLDRLSVADARSLDRYMRERGGAVVLVPDQRIDAGPARDLIAGPDIVERLLEQPAKLAVTPPAASLQASELLVLRALTPGSDVIARVPGSDGSPVIVSTPRGEGRLLLSGAMDAWRFRAADEGAFDRFWQSTIAGLALAAPPPIAISVVPPLLRPGERGEVVVRLRSQIVTSISASLDGDQPIRLRPEPEAGVYRGSFTAKSAPGRSTIEVRAAAAEPLLASRTLLVQGDVQRVRLDAMPSLSMLASSHRGIDVTPGRVADLERFLRSSVISPATTLVRHPMRSTWWILPFGVCLSAEWWMRRRRGLR